jgi:hypothetical protein
MLLDECCSILVNLPASFLKMVLEQGWSYPSQGFCICFISINGIRARLELSKFRFLHELVRINVFY